ncbi:hypothetical protein [Streptomyces mobaraensis]|uniref:Uncharacterized protein n=1 Tax=Streptomyces mobaraensis TaxID=35621 RepID=A0A5N5WEN1_STRMB|nr:hypothetical protein [Streptomyces mobaraensis]KAB7852324.1 hypothetical protein FRZ00_02140 [Streptomyces mobaraensis]
MPHVRRNVASIGLAAALMFGAGIATAGSAVADQSVSAPVVSRTSIAPAEWQFSGFYSSYESCRISGRTSGTQFSCRYDASVPVWRLFLWL